MTRHLTSQPPILPSNLVEANCNSLVTSFFYGVPFAHGKQKFMSDKKWRRFKKDIFGTINHSLEVTFIAVQLAERLGIQGRDLSLTACAALLHDVSKFAMNPRILFSSHRFNKIEHRYVENHPTNSYEIVSKMETDALNTYVERLNRLDLLGSHSLPRFADSDKGAAASIGYFVGQHHEHYNGTGYPNKASKDDLHLISCVIMAADKFDALTQKRCYKKESKTPHEVMNYFNEEEESKKFHPDVLAALNAYVKETYPTDFYRPQSKALKNQHFVVTGKACHNN